MLVLGHNCGGAAAGGRVVANEYSRLQILTIKELLGGKKIDMPQTRGVNITFKQAPKAKVAVGGPDQLSLLNDDE